MRRTLGLLLLFLAGCAGPDSDPVKIAERFHAMRVAGDDRGIHDLLTEVDRANVPMEAFPSALPSGTMARLLGWSGAVLESASLLSIRGDTAAVVLAVAGGARDTLRLVATHDPLRLWRYERDRVRWRVSMQLAERVRIDSLAAALRTDNPGIDRASVERAEVYLRAAEHYPTMARPADVQAASRILRAGTVATALRIELRSTESQLGVPFMAGHVENPTDRRVAALRLILRDTAGAEESLELWNVPPESSTPVWQLTRLRKGPLTHRLERIQLF